MGGCEGGVVASVVASGSLGCEGGVVASGSLGCEARGQG